MQQSHRYRLVLHSLNDRYPGHSIPLRVISDLVSSCTTCQKTNLAMENSLPSKTFHLKPQYHLKRVL
jgi:hypothetical protein